ncbi:hypothetical protein Leryth_010233 [Lithospermum erythrorhizon]|uniref:Phytocyanin domain-containing protein n=1 Tax=Lithospermum erythrorhizon TaxID=34254 RepID=A0AAV3R1H2_LITER|nr:hypothetical protein Leryth_010233 [Lithospermum erythrorhizon]
MNYFLTLLGTLTIMFPVLASPVEAISFKVGDSEGWHSPGIDKPETFTLWTARKTFHVMDILWFEYKNDSVLVVDKWGYYHCDTTKPSSVFNDGNTTLVLDNPGKFYFISGDPQHCEEGQRLFVNVLPLPSNADSPAPSPVTSISGSSVVSVTVVSMLVSIAISALAI